MLVVVGVAAEVLVDVEVGVVDVDVGVVLVDVAVVEVLVSVLIPVSVSDPSNPPNPNCRGTCFNDLLAMIGVIRAGATCCAEAAATSRHRIGRLAFI